MAKKKNPSKKHKFKHVEQVNPASGSVAGSTSPAATVATAKAPVRKQAVAMQSVTRDFSYVVTDVRRIGILAVSLVALELVLWFVFSHTAVGPAVYKLVGV